MRAVCLHAATSIASLLVGTWLGLGRPDVKAAQESASFAYYAVVGRPSKLVERSYSPPVDVAPPTVGGDLASVAAPPSPLEWPSLNPGGKISRAWLLAEGPYHPPGDNHRYIALTFDDGPFPETTPHVLDLLKKHGVHATFFVIGRYLEGDDHRSSLARDVVRRAVAEGNLIGNHTEDHRHLTEVSRPEALAQIDDCARAVEGVTGAPPLFFRPPYGDLSRYLERVMGERKSEVVLWSIEADDMHREDEKAVAHELRLRLEFSQGGIVLLHDMHWKSVVALDRLLRWLDDHKWDPEHPENVGYEVVDLPEYLRLTAASPQPFPNRQALDDSRRAAWRKAHPEAVAPKAATGKGEAPKLGAPDSSKPKPDMAGARPDTMT